MNARVFAGDLHAFGLNVMDDDDPRVAIALPSLLQPECMEALLLGLYGPQLMPEYRPVLVSQWAKYCFMQIIPPVLVVQLAHGWQWPLEPAQIALALDKRGIPEAVRFLRAGAVIPGQTCDPLMRFSGLLDDCLAPLVESLSAYGSLSHAVLWSSAGDTLENCLTRLEGIEADLAKAGWPLLTQERHNDGRRNRLFQTITYNPQRQRKACCLSHQVAWVGRCEHCPVGSGFDGHQAQ